MKQKKILFINIGWEQHPTIELLIKKKFKIYGVCFDKENIYHNYFEKVLYCKFDEIKKIFKFVKQIKPDGVISDQCDFSYKIHSLITTKFKLLGPKFNNAKLFTNKLLQRKLLQKSNFKVPNFFSTTKFEDALKKMKKLNSKKIVIKPIDNRGGFGVNILQRNNLNKIIFNKSIKYSKSKNIIIEEFIEGDHYNLDGMCFNQKFKLMGVSYNKKMSNEIVNQHIYYDQKFLKKKEFNIFFNKICKIFKPNFGLIHAEIIVDKKKNIFLTEIANRGGGVRISNSILPYISGYDVNNYLIKIALKKKISLKKTIRKSKAVLIRFLPIRKNLSKSNIKNKNVIFFKKLSNYKIISNSSRRNFMIIAKGYDFSKINNIINLTLKKLI